MENATLKPYADYKPSGIDWLGDVPAHWTTPNLGLLFKFKGSGTTPKDDQWYGGSVPWVMTGDLNDTTITTTRRTVLPEAVHEFSALRMYPPGSLIVAMYGATIGKTGLLRIDACTNQACCVLSEPIDGVEVKYLQSVVNSARSNLIEKGYGGGQPNINAHIVRSLRIPVPPLDEQTAIVRYLDYTDDRIRRAISAKERLIELLTEQRQAVIHRAVTRGLDPNVRLKDSGVEWLGDVPEHWDVRRFSRQISIAEGQVDPTVEPYASMPLIAPNHLEAKTGRLLHQETASEQGAISSKYFCRAGDVIYSKIRPALAKVVVAPTDCLCSADMYPLSPRHSLQANYLFWLLLSEALTAWSVLESDRVAMPKVNRATLNSYYIPIPSLPEQSLIIRYLDKATADIDTAIDKTQRQIDLLREYRTRLIADVVTGQVDVRGAVRDEVELPVS